MLIDAFCEGWTEELDQRARTLDRPSQLILLVDGAFIAGLHKLIAADQKEILFASLPGCSEFAIDVSPFLTVYRPDCGRLWTLLERCNRWPMLSAIETPESLGHLATRLAAWCVVEAGGLRFNLRFPDTRRLPAIFATMTPPQRAAFAGPMQRWSYIGRDGHWIDLPLNSKNEEGIAESILDEQQFANLVDDSGVDERLVLLRDRGHDVFRHPSRSYALLVAALRAARVGRLGDDDVLQWCEWFWKQGELHDDHATASLLQSWRKDS